MRPGVPIAATLAAALAAGCVPSQQATPTRQQGSLQEVRFGQIPGWPDDKLAETLPALRAQCHRLALLPADTRLGGAGLAAEFGGQAGQWSPACQAAGAIEPGDEPAMRRFYETWFQPYQITDTSLITGYYEPEVSGSPARGGPYQTPLLARPADLLQNPPPASDTSGKPAIGRLQNGRLVPYWTRADIEDGRAGATSRTLFYLADPADLFFLQMQGSGRIRQPDGSVVRIAYDGKNGRPYTPIGRVLVQQNAMAAEDVTMQSIRAWLAANPGRARAVMDRNEDYVFFRILTGADPAMGPPGALGTDLLAGRTAAIDRHALPLGTPLFLDTTDPLTRAPWRHLVLAQDLGTDIVGPARTGLFLGAGPLAEAQAGRMHQPGTDYILLPRPSS